MVNVDDKNYKSIQKKYESIHRVIVLLRILCIAAIVIPLMVIGASSKTVVSDTTAQIVLIVIVISVVGLLILAIIGWDASNVIRECRKVATKTWFQQYKDKEEDLSNALKKLGITDRRHSGGDYLCFGNNKLYILDSTDMDSVRRYAEKQGDESLRLIANSKLESRSIEIKDILFFSKEGDIQYTTSISGGGGGGSSISGAIVGGVIAGEAGAIIGSRKKVEEIKTVVNEHDSRESVLRYKKADRTIEKRYNGFDVYKFLFDHIPEKDLLNIQLTRNAERDTEIITNNSVPITKDKNESLEDKLKVLKDLYEKDLIEKEEYEKKRKELIDLI